jgi:CRP-like cAMP-binding protein
VLGKRGTRVNASDALDSCFSAEEIERRVATREGRGQMFREAGVMLEMADYAENSGEPEVATVVARVRAHAFAIRVETALRLAGRRKA